MNEKTKETLRPLPAALVMSLGSCAVVLGGLGIWTDYLSSDELLPRTLVVPLLGVVIAATLTGVGVARTGRRFPVKHMAAGLAVVALLTGFTCLRAQASEHHPKLPAPVAPPNNVA